jgi:CHC2 zinc finger
MARKRRREWDPNGVHAYFERSLSGIRWQGAQGITRCPFHRDRHPSLSINCELAVFFCHACGAKGDVVTFECLVSHCDRAAAMKRLSNLLI